MHFETSHIPIPETDIELEVQYSKITSSRSPPFAAIICGPHPLFGGNMHNNVVSAVFSRLIEVEIPVLRFNYRGSGKSGGEYSGGSEEINDLIYLVKYFLKKVDLKRVFIVGYSFGAAVGGVVATRLAGIAELAAIAMPFAHFPDLAEEIKASPPLRMLFVAGKQDNVASFATFKQETNFLGEKSQVQVIEGADHFYRGFEREVAEIVVNFALNAGK